jgi:flavodoxin
MKKKGDLMKILVAYDSQFGNTAQIAQAIAGAMAPANEVSALRVVDVQSEHLMDLDLFIVGSPTQAFSAIGTVKKMLDSLSSQQLKGVKIAAFDTRMSVEDVNSRIFTPMAKVFGYAAKPIADRLEKKGGILVIPPEGFFVMGEQGPLKEGELERAASWARQVLENSQEVR